jgi:hypothetical protein
MDDFNLTKVEILIRLGKGGKSRIDYLGKTSRRAVLASLKSHDQI